MSAAPQGLRRDAPTWLSYGLMAYYVFMLNVLGPVTPFLRQELGLSATIASLHASALAAGLLVASAAAPRLVARLGRRGAIWLGGSGLAAASVCLALSRSPAGTLPSALAMGSVGTLLLVVLSAQLADRHPAHTAAVLSEANVGGAAGATLAPLLVGVCGALGLGWRAAVLAGAASFGLLAIGLARVGVGAEPAAEGPRATGRGRLPRRYWSYWAVLVLVVAVEFGLVFWVASFLVAARGWAAADAVIASATFPALMAVGRVGGAAATRRAAPLAVLFASLGLALAGALLIWLSPLTATTVVGLALTGLGVANLYPLTLERALSAAPGQSDLASARSAFASGGAILSAPLLLGALADWAGLARAFGVIPCLALAALALLALTSRGGRR
jgi:fucose permease